MPFCYWPARNLNSYLDVICNIIDSFNDIMLSLSCTLLFWRSILTMYPTFPDFSFGITATETPPLLLRKNQRERLPFSSVEKGMPKYLLHCCKTPLQLTSLSLSIFSSSFIFSSKNIFLAIRLKASIFSLLVSSDTVKGCAHLLSAWASAPSPSPMSRATAFWLSPPVDILKMIIILSCTHRTFPVAVIFIENFLNVKFSDFSFFTISSYHLLLLFGCLSTLSQNLSTWPHSRFLWLR